MTDASGYAMEKAFAQRRAGLLPADPDADERYLDSLLIVLPDPERHGVWLAPRPLTDEERTAVSAGKPGLRGRIVRKDQVAQEAQQQTFLQRLRARRRAEAAVREAKRLEKEAARFG